MQKRNILFGILFVLTMLACKKQKDEIEDNIQSAIDFHLLEAIHQSIEIGVLPHFMQPDGVEIKDLSEVSNISYDGKNLNLFSPSSTNPHVYNFSYDPEIKNFENRSIEGEIQVSYYGAEVDTISIEVNALVGNINTKVNADYFNLFEKTVEAWSRVEMTMKDSNYIWLETQREIKPIDQVENPYEKQEIVLKGEGIDRLGQRFWITTNGKVERKYNCRNLFYGGATIIVDLLPKKDITYPENCNGATKVYSNNVETNIKFY